MPPLKKRWAELSYYTFCQQQSDNRGAGKNQLVHQGMQVHAIPFIPLLQQYAAVFIAGRTREIFGVQRTWIHRKTGFRGSAAHKIGLLSSLKCIWAFFYVDRNWICLLPQCLNFNLRVCEDKTHLQTCIPKSEFLSFPGLSFSWVWLWCLSSSSKEITKPN